MPASARRGRRCVVCRALRRRGCVRTTLKSGSFKPDAYNHLFFLDQRLRAAVCETYVHCALCAATLWHSAVVAPLAETSTYVCVHQPSLPLIERILSEVVGAIELMRARDHMLGEHYSGVIKLRLQSPPGMDPAIFGLVGMAVSAGRLASHLLCSVAGGAQRPMPATNIHMLLLLAV